MEAISSSGFPAITRMPFVSKVQVKYMFSQHPEIARRWVSKYGLRYKSLPKRKKKAARKRLKAALYAAEALVYGQPGNPSTLQRTFGDNGALDPAAVQASKMSAKRNRYVMSEKLKLMRMVAKLTKYRLKKMGYLGNEQKARYKRIRQIATVRS